MDIMVKFVDPNTRKLVDYDPCNHKNKALKFLFFLGKTLKQKKALLIIGSWTINEHRELLAYIARLIEFEDIMDKLPKADGAGNCQNGAIKDWESVRFNILTPEKFRPIIEKALDMTQR